MVRAKIKPKKNSMWKQIHGKRNTSAIFVYTIETNWERGKRPRTHENCLKEEQNRAEQSEAEKNSLKRECVCVSNKSKQPKQIHISDGWVSYWCKERAGRRRARVSWRFSGSGCVSLYSWNLFSTRAPHMQYFSFRLLSFCVSMGIPHSTMCFSHREKHRPCSNLWK